MSAIARVKLNVRNKSSISKACQELGWRFESTGEKSLVVTKDRISVTFDLESGRAVYDSDYRHEVDKLLRRCQVEEVLHRCKEMGYSELVSMEEEEDGSTVLTLMSYAD